MTQGKSFLKLSLAIRFFIRIATVFVDVIIRSASTTFHSGLIFVLGILERAKSLLVGFP